MSRSTWRHRVGAATLAATFGLTSALVGVSAAQAAAPGNFSVDVTPTTGLSDGDEITVTLNNVNAADGVYVMYCVQPESGNRAPSGDCDGSAQVWVVDDYPYGTRPTDGSVQYRADGPFTLAVPSTIGTNDCTEVICGIQVRRDHPAGNTDTSYDTFVPLSFSDDQTGGGDSGDGGGGDDTGNEDETTEFSVDVSPADELQDGDVVDVTLNNVPREVGLYVQYCVQQPGGQRAGGDQCDGSGTWALGENPYGAGTDSPVDGPILDPADGPIPTTVATSIGSVDCTEVVCGIQTRRDHRGGGDPTYDTFTPVTFAADAVVNIEDDTDEPVEGETVDGTGDEGGTEETARSGEEIAATGSSTATLAVAAALLIAVGGATVAGSRRLGTR